MSNPDAQDPIDKLVVSDAADDQARALVTAARKIAVELVSADESREARAQEVNDRREHRELVRVIVLAIIVGLPSIIGASAAVLGAIQGRQTHDAVNSRMTELLEEVSKSQRAEGVLEGRAKRDM